ncbi:hypothetical protein DFH06DRAFT_1152997 [Mycena polygramma]|nr:hypothetical protein DFH06DRAFT_1152997 [Mycena polygramma]
MCAWEATGAFNSFAHIDPSYLEASHTVPADQHDDPAMIHYLAAAQEFQAEFGYPFSGGDGWDPHFKRMAFHASVAQHLRHRFHNDTQKIEAEMSKPRYTCIVCNPFSEGDPRREDLELKRVYLCPIPKCEVLNTQAVPQTKRFHEGADTVVRLPASINPHFPLSLRVPRNPNGYYHTTTSNPPDTTSEKCSRWLTPQPRQAYGMRFAPISHKELTDKFRTRGFVAKGPGNTLPHASRLVTQPAVLHIFRFPYFNIYPIQLAHRNVRHIVKDLPVGTQLRVDEPRALFQGGNCGVSSGKLAAKGSMFARKRSNAESKNPTQSQRENSSEIAGQNTRLGFTRRVRDSDAKSKGDKFRQVTNWEQERKDDLLGSRRRFGSSRVQDRTGSAYEQFGNQKKGIEDSDNQTQSPRPRRKVKGREVQKQNEIVYLARKRQGEKFSVAKMKENVNRTSAVDFVSGLRYRLCLPLNSLLGNVAVMGRVPHDHPMYCFAISCGPFAPPMPITEAFVSLKAWGNSYFLYLDFLNSKVPAIANPDAPTHGNEELALMRSDSVENEARREGWNQQFPDHWNKLFLSWNYLVPKHNYHAHQNQCHLAWCSLNHHATCGEEVETGWATNGSAHQTPFQHSMDGECLESEWAELNPVAGSTRQMSEGSHHSNHCLPPPLDHHDVECGSVAGLTDQLRKIPRLDHRDSLTTIGNLSYAFPGRRLGEQCGCLLVTARIRGFNEQLRKAFLTEPPTLELRKKQIRLQRPSESGFFRNPSKKEISRRRLLKEGGMRWAKENSGDEEFSCKNHANLLSRSPRETWRLEDKFMRGGAEFGIAAPKYPVRGNHELNPKLERPGWAKDDAHDGAKRLSNRRTIDRIPLPASTRIPEVKETAGCDLNASPWHPAIYTSRRVHAMLILLELARRLARKSERAREPWGSAIKDGGDRTKVFVSKLRMKF